MEIDFIFIDDKGRPCWCKMWDDSLWLFYLNQNNRWVSLREVDQKDIFTFPSNLTKEEHESYRNIDKEFNLEKSK